jgi:hypothetical protein
LIPSFNVGATQNIQGNAGALANPGILASNNQMNAMNALQMARMNSGQGFANIGNNLANQQTQFNIQQQQPGLFNYLNAGAGALQGGMQLNNYSKNQMNPNQQSAYNNLIQGF